MRYFLVHTVVTLPAHKADEIAPLRAEEVARAHDLQREGTLVALWREAGRLASFGVWRGSDEEDVRAQLATLPMRGYMNVTITELESHPNALHAFPFTVEEQTSS